MRHSVKKIDSKMVVLGVVALSMATLFCPNLSGAARINEEAAVLTGADLQKVTFTVNADNSVTLAFAAQNPNNPPAPAGGIAEARIGTSSGAFVGNYIADEIAGLKFSIKGSGVLPQKIQAEIESDLGNGEYHVWVNDNITVSTTPNEWVTNALAMTRTAGWDLYVIGDPDMDALWADDLTRVTMIGLRIKPSGWAAQSYTIDEFKLVDINGLESDPAELTLQEVLMARFGVDSVEEVSEADAAVDTDGDGMTDLNEIQTAYDPAYENATFAAEIVSVDANGTTIKWPCKEGRTYDVIRAGALGDTFTVIRTGLVASETGYMTYLDENGVEGKFFYRIRRLE